MATGMAGRGASTQGCLPVLREDEQLSDVGLEALPSVSTFRTEGALPNILDPTLVQAIERGRRRPLPKVEQRLLAEKEVQEVLGAGGSDKSQPQVLAVVPARATGIIGRAAQAATRRAGAAATCGDLPEMRPLRHGCRLVASPSHGSVGDAGGPCRCNVGLRAFKGFGCKEAGADGEGEEQEEKGDDTGFSSPSSSARMEIARKAARAESQRARRANMVATCGDLPDSMRWLQGSQPRHSQVVSFQSEGQLSIVSDLGLEPDD